jgi:hypothetical protein
MKEVQRWGWRSFACVDRIECIVLGKNEKEEQVQLKNWSK